MRRAKYVFSHGLAVPAVQYAYANVGILIIILNRLYYSN